MSYPRIFRNVIAGAAAALLIGLAAPAHAQQTGRMICKVTDESNNPIPDAQITLEYVGDIEQKIQAKTDSHGTLVRAGLIPGRWRITGTKGDLTGFFVASVSLGEDVAPVTLVLRAGKAAAAAAEASKLSAAEVAKRNKEQKELEDTFNAAKAALDSGNSDEALIKLNSVVQLSPKCAACYAKIGDVYVTKKDSPNAETAYKKAIEIDPTLADVYVALAAVLADEKKFDEATAMGAKANTLSKASGGAGNPTALYNQGVILWNQGKSEEARPLFEQAIAADPKLAEAYYMLGMIYVGMDKKPEAIKALETYLSLAPTGDNAATAKAILAQIK
jgi:tetratricopeptide (TPR) repeat protein